MNQYEISTAQNVTIRLTIANMGDRILAAMIDMLVLLGYLLIWIYVVNTLEGNVSNDFESAPFWIEMVFTLPVYFYTLLFEFFMDGQTPGKRLRKIKVVRMDGESLTLGNCIIRWLFRIVDIWFDSGSVAIVSATFSKLHQRLGDMVAGTIVISTRQNSDVGVAQYADLNVGTAVHFPQVERLHFRDMEVITEALTLYYESDTFDYVHQVASKLKTLLDVMPDMDDLSFVKRVVTDYNILHRVSLD